MADYASRWVENVPGLYFVDEACIDCDLCRSIAADFFSRSEQGYSYVSLQPSQEAQRAMVEAALAECPVDAIGTQPSQTDPTRSPRE